MTCFAKHMELLYITSFDSTTSIFAGSSLPVVIFWCVFEDLDSARSTPQDELILRNMFGCLSVKDVSIVVWPSKVNVSVSHFSTLSFSPNLVSHPFFGGNTPNVHKILHRPFLVICTPRKKKTWNLKITYT